MIQMNSSVQNRLNASLLMLCLAATACAQDSPPAPQAPPVQDGAAWPEPPGEIRSYFWGYTSADSALADLESSLDTGRLTTLRPIQSLHAYGDSARHYQRTLALAERESRERPNAASTTAGLLLVLRDMGARRPFFRGLVRDVRQNPGLARAAVYALSMDPNEAELREMEALDENVFDDYQTNAAFDYTINEAISGYRSQLRFWTRYREAQTLDAKMRLLGLPVPYGYEHAMHTLYAQDPAGVTAWIDAHTGEDSYVRVQTKEMLAAPADMVTLGGIPGPMLPRIAPGPVAQVPACDGRPATVYVAAGRVVGGPLAGTLYAGRLVGTPGPDVLVGTDAADALLGLAGDDTLCGGDGSDALDAGPGADTADGGPGTDGCDAAETASACEGPVPALADVRPVLECVAGAPGGGFVAYFGVENKTTRAGRVAYGASNRITPAALDRAQPDLFGLPAVVAGRPGRTPFYPGHAFTVPFAAGQTVVWKLFSRTSTASASSPRCPAP